jgi:hypothetical protein
VLEKRFWGGVSALTCKARPAKGNELSDDAYEIVGGVNDDIWRGASNLMVMSLMSWLFLSDTQGGIICQE